MAIGRKQGTGTETKEGITTVSNDMSFEGTGRTDRT